jgi:predicted nucleic-acid-binding Zn-ribbon protein
MDRHLVKTGLINCPACRLQEGMRVEPSPALIEFANDPEPHMYYAIRCNKCGYGFFWDAYSSYDPSNLHPDLTRLSDEEQLAQDPTVLDT